MDAVGAARTIEVVIIVDEGRALTAPMRLVRAGRGPEDTPTTTITKVSRCLVMTKRHSSMVVNPSTIQGVIVGHPGVLVVVVVDSRELGTFALSVARKGIGPTNMDTPSWCRCAFVHPRSSWGRRKTKVPSRRETSERVLRAEC